MAGPLSTPDRWAGRDVPAARPVLRGRSLRGRGLRRTRPALQGSPVVRSPRLGLVAGHRNPSAGDGCPGSRSPAGVRIRVDVPVAGTTAGWPVTAGRRGRAGCRSREAAGRIPAGWNGFRLTRSVRHPVPVVSANLLEQKVRSARLGFPDRPVMPGGMGPGAGRKGSGWGSRGVQVRRAGGRPAMGAVTTCLLNPTIVGPPQPVVPTCQSSTGFP